MGTHFNIIYVLKNLGSSDTRTDTQEKDDRKRHGGGRHLHPQANEKGSFPDRCKRSHR